MDIDGQQLTLAEKVRQVRNGSFSARHLTETVQHRIATGDSEIRAWVERSAAAPEQAGRLDREGVDGALAGIPVGVKDIIDVAGLPTRCGSTVTSPQPVARSAACVRRLEDLGAVVQGKTVTTEFAYFTPGPTRNPRDTSRTPGGSSSGSAAAVAAGMVPLALGSQTAGSLTRPAAYCGVAGMVLRHGQADLAGVTGLAPSLDSLGMLARSVDDLRYAYGAFTDEPIGSGRAASVQVWAGSGLAELDPAMSDLVDRLQSLLATLGQPVVRLDYDDHVQTLAHDHTVIMAVEAAAELGPLLAAHGAALSPHLHALAAQGRDTPAQDYDSALFRRSRSLEELRNLLDGAVIVGPAAPGVAPMGLQATGSPVLSRPWQAMGLPVVTIPGATDPRGLPLGLQMIGWPGQEEALLNTAADLQALLEHPDR
ncbi:MAG: amidase [Actinomycetales bacterium]